MQLTVQGKQMDVGEALKTYAMEKITDINEKYFNHGVHATVTFSREGHGHQQTKTNINLQVGKKIMVIGDATEADPYVSFDKAADRVGKQLRRYKRKLRDHHERIEQTPETEILKARRYVLAAEQDDAPQDDEDTGGGEPLVIAEMASDVEILSVSEAVMRMDLADVNAMMFRNAKTERLNVVYRRSDGNIGWIDPEG
jgi:ribosomal subunit interface protein